MAEESRRRRKNRQASETHASGDLLDNVQVAAAIQGALLTLAPSTGLRVDVDVEKGVVYLRGEVVSEWQKSEAERLARSLRIRGIKHIRNELTVNPFLPPLPHP